MRTAVSPADNAAPDWSTGVNEQVLLMIELLAMVIAPGLVGNVSVMAEDVVIANAFWLPSCIVIAVVPPTTIVASLKLLAIVGG